jgi:hypothetical protein
MNKLRLRFVLDVDYSLNGTSKRRMVENLKSIVERAMGNGEFTEESKAEVDCWNTKVEERKHSIGVRS